MDESLVLHILSVGAITLRGQLLRGSNYTFLARAEIAAQQVDAVYKPAKGEQPLWDFPVRTLGKREAAAYQVSQFLGWNLVPPTVYRTRDLPLGAGSLQFYFRHDPSDHFFNFTSEFRLGLVPVAVYDVLVNNADRKGGHILLDDTGQLRCIDQGLCFHIQDKLRTVIWAFAGQPIPPDLLADVKRLEINLTGSSPFANQLARLLSQEEVAALRSRCQRLLANPVLPEFDDIRRMLPYPPL